MNRLTEKDCKGNKLVLKNAVECVSDDLKEWSISTSKTGTQTIRGYAVDKFAEYEDLEEQNRLLKLPCAIGDLLYESQIDTGMVVEYTAIHICYTGECEIFIGSKLNSEIYNEIKGICMDEIGKTVFLTKSEAEEVLTKMNESEDNQ